MLFRCFCLFLVCPYFRGFQWVDNLPFYALLIFCVDDQKFVAIWKLSFMISFITLSKLIICDQV